VVDSPRGQGGSPRKGPGRHRGDASTPSGPRRFGAKGKPAPRKPGRPAGQEGQDRPDRAGSTGRPQRPGRPERSAQSSGASSRQGKPRDVSGSSRQRPAEGRANTPRSERQDGRERAQRASVEQVFPAVDPDVEPKQLDCFARRELSGLDKDDADFVAKHLVMAARLVEGEPERAHQHAVAALSKGSRIPVVRETLGITAYLTGDFALSLRELRTHRRLTGKDVNVPMMIDCERGLGRPLKGIELAVDVDRKALEPEVAVELAIALSGARLDLGDTKRALWELEIPQLDPNRAFSFSPALFDAYAAVLEDLGRSEEAAQWGRRADLAAAALHEAEEDPDEVMVIEVAEDETEPDTDHAASLPHQDQLDSGPEERAP
jgi:hypothetical protein